MFWNFVKIFLISMVPLVELRGAIPISQIWGMPIIPSYIVCIIGNMLPVPFIYLFAERFLEWGKNKKLIGKFCSFCLKKGRKAGKKIEKKVGEKGAFAALLLFVGIPIPGTGAWTGTLAASLLGLGFKKSATAVMIGVLLAGVIMMTVSALGGALL
jgi:uncharacterized membrane protein